LGREEKERIIPAISLARRRIKGILGPFPSDTIFYDALKGDYDCVIAMYHDQGLIPLKTLFRESCVNLTLGLGFVRTSPGHGTAFDIAGKNRANASALIEAIKLAYRCTIRRN
jgi:4-hydroxythreonine-4-phosphate dehydrogenase